MMRLGDTPVPIPNTTVKTQAVDGTWWAAAWESRWSPESNCSEMFYCLGAADLTLVTVSEAATDKT